MAARSPEGERLKSQSGTAVCVFYAMQGLKVASMQSHMRVLQRKIARAREELRGNQPGRLDLQIPSRSVTTAQSSFFDLLSQNE